MLVGKWHFLLDSSFSLNRDIKLSVHRNDQSLLILTSIAHSTGKVNTKLLPFKLFRTRKEKEESLPGKIVPNRHNPIKLLPMPFISG